jgi:hypothetical protein
MVGRPAYVYFGAAREPELIFSFPGNGTRGGFEIKSF